MATRMKNTWGSSGAVHCVEAVSGMENLFRVPVARVGNKATGRAAVIDPRRDVEPYVEVLMDKIRADNYPSIDLMSRVKELG